MSFVRISEQTATFTYTTLADWFCVTEVESVYCAVHTEFLYKHTRLVFEGLISTRLETRGFRK
jgi:hypothetical protein